MVSIKFVRSPKNFKLSTNYNKRINFIQNYMLLILRKWKVKKIN